MARQIKIRDIEKYHRESVELAVKLTTLEWEKRVIRATPVFNRSNYSQEELDAMPKLFRDSILEHRGGLLRESWRSNIRPLLGEIINPVEYAEPVCYGTNLPPSWGGKFRTRQDTIQGFPDLIGKELESYPAKILRRR